MKDLIIVGSDGSPVTTSLKVAEIFKKEHKHVIEAIENLDCSNEFRERNFRPSFYFSDLSSAGKRKYKMYEMTRDGFVILAMGFTGKKAMQFKEAYINAFNQMETSIKTGILPSQESNQKVEVIESFRFAKELGTEFGLEGNQLLLSASHFVKRHHGIDPMEELGVTHLLNHVQQTHLTPTELGERIGGGISPRKINTALEDLKFQTFWHSTKKKNGKERKVKHWIPTDAGKAYSVLLDTKKQHTDGTPVQQLKWLESVIPVLESHFGS